MSKVDLAGRIRDVRSFNRFYTGLVGALNEGLLSSSYSLTEARTLYELAERGETSATLLARDLQLDPAYLSRILRKFRTKKLVSARQSVRDGREQILTLTRKGRSEFQKLDKASSDEVAALLTPLSNERQDALVRAMATIRRQLESPADDCSGEPFVIRPPRPGDIGWVVHRHAVVYTRDYGWDGSFEGFVAEIAGNFLKTQDETREQCWIAEREGRIAGSVFLVDEGRNTAKLRMLYVEAEARGLGIGSRLVEEAIEFARGVGYRRAMLWTNDILVSARRIYEAAGFTLVSEEKHHSFGKDLVGQNWAREL